MLAQNTLFLVGRFHAAEVKTPMFVIHSPQSKTADGGSTQIATVKRKGQEAGAAGVLEGISADSFYLLSESIVLDVNSTRNKQKAGLCGPRGACGTVAPHLTTCGSTNT